MFVHQDQQTAQNLILQPILPPPFPVTQIWYRATLPFPLKRSDAGLDKHCFAYNIRITNESEHPIQLVSCSFLIQTAGSLSKDAVQGPGVAGQQPVLKPGKSVEYTRFEPPSKT